MGRPDAKTKSGQAGPPRVTVQSRGRKQFSPIHQDYWDVKKVNPDIPLIHPRAHDSYLRSRGEWKRILRFLSEYYRRNERDPHTRLFARQMLEIGYRSFDGTPNQSSDGWSGDFVQSVFTFTVDEMVANQAYWDSPPEPGLLHKFSPIPHGSRADDILASKCIGDSHFSRHLEPGFTAFIIKKLKLIAKTFPVDPIRALNVVRSGIQTQIRLKKMSQFLQEVSIEHENFIKKAVIPGFNAAGWEAVLTSVGKNAAADIVEHDARELRRKVIHNCLRKIQQQRMISVDERKFLAVTIPIGGLKAPYDEGNIGDSRWKEAADDLSRNLRENGGLN